MEKTNSTGRSTTWFTAVKSGSNIVVVAKMPYVQNSFWFFLLLKKMVVHLLVEILTGGSERGYLRFIFWAFENPSSYMFFECKFRDKLINFN